MRWQKLKKMRILKIVSNLFSEIIFGKYLLGKKTANENIKQVPIINSPNLKPKNVRPTKGLANNIEKKSKKKYIYLKNSINLKSFNILLFKLAYTKGVNINKITFVFQSGRINRLNNSNEKFSKEFSILI